MRNFSIALSVVAVLALSTTAALAQATTAASSQSSASAAQSSSAAKYTTSDTEVGTLLDDPAAKAIIEKYIPGFTTNDQVDMARGMTLKAVQQYAPDKITDEILAKIDAEFAKLPAK